MHLTVLKSQQEVRAGLLKKGHPVMAAAHTEDGHSFRHNIGRLTVALSFPVVALLLEMFFWQGIQPYAWLLFYPSVFLSSYVGGKWAGIAATAVSALAAWWVFIPQPYSFALERPASLLAVGVFTAMGVLFSLTHERLRKANLHTAAALASANAERIHLEERVKERTADLEQTVALLGESESKYRMTLDSMLEGCQIVGFDWCYLYINAAAEIHNRRPSSELLGRPVLECWPGFAETDVYAREKRSMEERTVQSFDTEFVFPDGSPGWYRVIIQPATEGIVIFSEDITERKLAEKELKEQESTLRLILETLPVGVWIVDAEGNIIKGNRAGLDIWKGAHYVGIKGYGVYKGWWAGTDRRIQPEEWAAARAIMKGETSLDEEIDIECFDGTRKTILHSAVPLRDESQRLTGAVIINQDITARKRAEEALSEKRRLLQELNDNLEQRVGEAVSDVRRKDQILMQQSRQAAMGEMIGNIAHQWRQPLNTLGLIVQELRMTYGREDFTKEVLDAHVSKAMGLISHMSKTINDFSNFFRPDKEKGQFNVNQMVARTLSLVEPTLKSHDIRIEVVENDVTDIVGYSNEYSQVLLNILTNARDAFEGRNIRTQRLVTITIARESDRSVVTVADNAGGIQEDVMEKIFDPYFTTKGPDKGTGIGLYMAKAIIEKSMGGRLTARNTATGAEFRIEVGAAS
jgi:PAS domain S-box-containing protein